MAAWVFSNIYGKQQVLKRETSQIGQLKFRRKRSTGDLIIYPNERSNRRDESQILALSISKEFNRFWQEAYLVIQLFNQIDWTFYLYSKKSSGAISSQKTINGGVPQDYIRIRHFFQFFLIGLLSSKIDS